MKLSRDFWLSEFTRSQVASRHGIDNTPGRGVVDNMRRLCEHVLQPLRTRLDTPIVVTSGYRCPALNRAVGGSRESQHMFGEAADVEALGVSNVVLALTLSRMHVWFDQLILEYWDGVDPRSGWVHVSHREGRNRCELLTKVRGERGYRLGLPK